MGSVWSAIFGFVCIFSFVIPLVTGRSGPGLAVLPAHRSWQRVHAFSNRLTGDAMGPYPNSYVVVPRMGALTIPLRAPGARYPRCKLGKSAHRASFVTLRVQRPHRPLAVRAPGGGSAQNLHRWGGKARIGGGIAPLRQACCRRCCWCRRCFRLRSIGLCAARSWHGKCVVNCRLKAPD
jgi:hypothetical protein